MRRLVPIMAALVVAGPAFAQNEETDPVIGRYTPAYDKCLESPEGQSTAGMIGCIGQ